MLILTLAPTLPLAPTLTLTKATLAPPLTLTKARAPRAIGLVAPRQHRPRDDGDAGQISPISPLYLPSPISLALTPTLTVTLALALALTPTLTLSLPYLLTTPTPEQADFDAELLRGSAEGGAQQKGQRPKRAGGVTTAATRGGSRARTARVLPEYEIELPDE